MSFTVETTKQERSGTEGLTVADGEDDELNQYDRTSFSLSHLGRWNALGQYWDSLFSTSEITTNLAKCRWKIRLQKSTLVMPLRSTLSVLVSKVNTQTQ